MKTRTPPRIIPAFIRIGKASKCSSEDRIVAIPETGHSLLMYELQISITSGGD
jgi:hypothetical protein